MGKGVRSISGGESGRSRAGSRAVHKKRGAIREMERWTDSSLEYRILRTLAAAS